MSTRLTGFVNGEYYHIYNRGNSKMEIFHDQEDYLYLQNLFFIMNTEERFKSRFVKNEENKNHTTDLLVSLGAYCIMPNHFHILLKQEKENGISKFMQKLSTAYVMYYNKKYKRTGSLFEGKFKSKYVTEDTYLRYLFSYIHMNPLKILDPDWKNKAKYPSREMIAFLEQYRYSSFHEYRMDHFMVINRQAFPDYFPTKQPLLSGLTSWFDCIQ